MNGSGITYEDVIAANVRNQKDKEIENLKQEIERLNNIIGEAIEYINTGSIFDASAMCKNDLLEILKGSDKEWK